MIFLANDSSLEIIKALLKESRSKDRRKEKTGSYCHLK
jgi:hypothetical protein